jgi:hypothetical protein
MELLLFSRKKGICLYCSSVLLTLFPTCCMKGNLENISLEIWFKVIRWLNFDKLPNVSIAEGSQHVTWLRTSSTTDLQLCLTFYISRWASALLFCCRNLLHAAKNLTPKSNWLIFFSVFWHRTVCSEDSSDVRIFVGTIHEDQLWFVKKCCSVFQIPAQQLLQTQRTSSFCCLTKFPLEVSL